MLQFLSTTLANESDFEADPSSFTDYLHTSNDVDASTPSTGGSGAPGAKLSPADAELSLTLSATLSGHSVKVACCAFSHDGELLATGGHDKTVLLWSVASRKQICTLEGHTQLVTDVRFSPDARGLLAAASFDHTVRIWTVPSAAAAASAAASVKVLQGHGVSVTAVDFAHGAAMADTLCSGDADGTLKVWSLSTASCRATMRVRREKASFWFIF